MSVSHVQDVQVNVFISCIRLLFPYYLILFSGQGFNVSALHSLGAFKQTELEQPPFIRACSLGVIMLVIT